MDNTAREARLGSAFVTLADTLVSDFDVFDLIHTLLEVCTEVLDTSAGGLMLADAAGVLRLMASTREGVDFIEVAQLSAEAGPCWDCFQTGAPVTVGDISDVADVWPDFARAALDRGYRSVHATPMRLRGRMIGTMNLFHTAIGEMNPRDIAIAQSLTDVATIAIIQEQRAHDLETVGAQLQHALDSRIVIEQAKGVIAQSQRISMDAAFGMLRRYARSTNRTLQSVSDDITSRRLQVEAVTARA